MIPVAQLCPEACRPPAEPLEEPAGTTSAGRPVKSKEGPAVRRTARALDNSWRADASRAVAQQVPSHPGSSPGSPVRSNSTMNEQERLVSDQINGETATLHAVDPQTAKLIGALDSYRERFEEAGGDPGDALVTGIEYALKEAGVINPAEVFLHGMAYAQHHLRPDSDCGGSYWRLVGPVWGKISIYEGPEVFLRQYRQVRPEVGHLFAAHWCQSEVRYDGFYQFFWISTGVLAPEAVEGFRAIGLPGCAELLAEAMRYFGVPYPRERVERLSELAGECDPFTELDARFWAQVEWARWARAADAYARRFGA
jgi:hypothetical protein